MSKAFFLSLPISELTQLHAMERPVCGLLTQRSGFVLVSWGSFC